ncbi:MAG: PAS domain-containing protein, partial [Pricia sp.]
MVNSKDRLPLDTATFQRMQKWYLLALAGIALSIIIAQILIQTHLNSQLNDSRVINVAGRPRASSQKLVKEVLLLKETNAETEKREILSEIEQTLSVWKASHQGLQHGDPSLNLPVEDDETIRALFGKMEPHYAAMVQAVEDIVQKVTGSSDGEIPRNDIAILLDNERTFLQMMDGIVNEYDRRSKEQLENLKQKEYLLLAFSLMIIVLEILFIFRPLSIQIRKTIGKLMQSRQKSDTHAKEIQQLFSEKEKSLQELQELNFVIDNAALFASARRDGQVVFISKKFLTLLGYSERDKNKPLSELLTTDEGQQEYLKEVLKSNRKNVIRTEEIKIMTKSGEEIWLDMSIVPMHQSSRQQSILILCSDITERIENQLKVAQLTQQNFQERMLQKKQQASQIVEGQEEERKRIAKDIHDGIGQMLTALKFNIESIDIENTAKTAE